MLLYFNQRRQQQRQQQEAVTYLESHQKQSVERMLRLTDKCCCQRENECKSILQNYVLPRAGRRKSRMDAHWLSAHRRQFFLNSKVFSLSRHAHVLAGLSYCPPYLRAIPQPGRAYLGKVLQDQRRRAKMSEGWMQGALDAR